MRDIILHGHLAQRFGTKHTLSVESAAEAVKALSVLRPGFRDVIRQGEYRVVRGDVDDGLNLSIDALHMRLGSRELHFIPETAGAGRGTGMAARP